MKFLFYVAKLYSVPVVVPIINYLTNLNEHDYLIFASQKVKDNLIEKHRIDNNKFASDIKKAINFRPDFCLSPGNYVDFRLPGIKVEIFHGLGIEKESHYKIRHFFDVYLTSGPTVTQKYVELQKKYKYFAVRETGWAKVDYILSYPSKHLRDSYNLPPNKNIILYAPTFSDKMQSAYDILPTIPDIVLDDEIWIVKFHELMDKTLITKYTNKSPDKILICREEDITPYLHIADVMISDTSSVIYEFMILDKPVITYRTLARKDKGINIDSVGELRQAINRSIARPEEYTTARKKHIAEVNPYLDSKISERIVSSLVDLINRQKPFRSRKPLNLTRKLKILYHEKFKKGYIK